RGFEVASSLDRPALSFANRLLAELPSTFQPLPVLGDEPGLPHLRGWLAEQQQAWHQGSGTPLLVALDDLHYLSPASAKALATLPTRYASGPVVWLLARRVHLGGAEVQRLFSSDSASVARIQLGAMTSTDTAALVRDIAQAEPAPELLALAKLA